MAWALAIVAMLSDLALTIYGHRLGLTELNPLAWILLQTYGVMALFPIKGIALLVAAIGWAMLPPRQRVLVPIVLAFPWCIASVLNLGAILAVVL